VQVDVSTALPESTYTRGTLVTVTLDDPNAVITGIALHGFQDSPDVPAEPEPFLPIFSYTGNGTEAPGLTRE
jgi:hypothetical protein